MKTAAEFLFAIKESTHTTYDDDATEYLDSVVTAMLGKMDNDGLTGRDRDNVIFYEGMLKGVQLRLSKDKYNEWMEANRADAETRVFKKIQSES
jgi:hypothetical protein